ncbi:P2 family phage major capsid protein, partial [Escherichia coli]
EPAVPQRFENASKESTEFTKRINVIGVTDQKGEKILPDTTGPIARTNSSYDGIKRRNPNNVIDMKSRQYQCEQVNYDTFISYPQLDTWAAHSDFQSRISTQIARQVALDRIMIGFNGTSHAYESDFHTNKLLQDVNVGWLEHIRTDASERVMNDVTLTSRNMDNTVAHAGKYANADALVQDARSSLLDEWHKEADDLVVIMGRNLFNSLRLPVLNSISGQNPNAELLAGQLILSSRTIGGLGVFLAPFFPDATMLITSFNNLSIYWQKGSMRR